MKKSDLKNIIRECLEELNTPTTRSIKHRKRNLSMGSRASQRGREHMNRIKNTIQEKAPKRVGDYGSTKRPNTLYGGMDVLANRENTANSVKKMNVDNSYKNKITKGHMKNDRRNKGSERVPIYFDDEGKLKRNIPKSSFKDSGVGR